MVPNRGELIELCEGLRWSREMSDNSCDIGLTQNIFVSEQMNHRKVVDRESEKTTFYMHCIRNGKIDKKSYVKPP